MKHLKWLIPVFIIAFCFLGFLIAPNDPEAMDIVNKYAAPSVDFPLGTDQFGRCELSGLLYGGKVTLGIVLLGGSIVLVLGTLIGLWLGRANAAKSLAFSSLLDAVTAIPPLAYLIIFVGIWGNSIPTMLVALTVSLILRMIKLVKTQTELELDKAYVLCAVSSGASRSRVLFVHRLAVSGQHIVYGADVGITATQIVCQPVGIQALHHQTILDMTAALSTPAALVVHTVFGMNRHHHCFLIIHDNPPKKGRGGKSVTAQNI